MIKRPQNVRLSQTPSRRPYEAPRLNIVELRPEEQLLGCDKTVLIPACAPILVLS